MDERNSDKETYYKLQDFESVPLTAGDLIGYDETSQLVGAPKGTIYSWVHTRYIPHIRLGPRMVKFSRKALADWLNKRIVPINTKKRTADELRYENFIQDSNDHLTPDSTQK